jgi:phosphoserine phosphatase SerB
MPESHTLIWITPVISQHELEGLYHWINLHLTELGLMPITSFSKIKTDFLFEPQEALKLQFEIRALSRPNSLELFKEALWSEIFAESQPAPRPFAISLQPDRVLKKPKKLACFDMDSTLINEEVIDEIARTSGFHERVSEITERAMKGELDFKASLRERVSLFQGMPKSQAESIIPSLHVSPGGEALLGHFRFNEIKTAVVSGGFEFILKHFQKQLFLDQVYGNVLETDDHEFFTGKVEDPIVDAEYKKKLVRQLKVNYSFDSEETIVVGDGANDMLMMSEAGLSVSFCGKPRLTAVTNTFILDRNLLWLRALI